MGNNSDINKFGLFPFCLQIAHIDINVSEFQSNVTDADQKKYS